MHIDILTILPRLLDGPFADSILQRAQNNALCKIEIHNIRDFSQDKHKSVDDYQFGGGAGMVMLAQPIVDAIEHLSKSRTYDDIIYLTPDGERLNQSVCNQMSLQKNVLLICGHYKGIDQRVRDHWITKEISIGDYVLSGGELAAAVLVDAVVRLIPGVMNDETSALTDSFQDDLLAPPVYTRPAEFRGHIVPEVLTSGNFKAIEQWRMEQAFEKTTIRRPDLLNGENQKRTNNELEQ
jgi:tRNA (guanine37-N1)-methyltransferase